MRRVLYWGIDMSEDRINLVEKDMETLKNEVLLLRWICIFQGLGIGMIGLVLAGMLT